MVHQTHQAMAQQDMEQLVSLNSALAVPTPASQGSYCNLKNQNKKFYLIPQRPPRQIQVTP